MSQLIKKFLANNAVDGTKIRLNNNEYIRSRNAANSADINSMKVNASDRIEFASVPQVTSDAVAANDLVRYSQFAGALDGLKPKAAVRVASTGPGVLATDFENGDTVDGIVLATGDRILIWQQTSAAENGIYIVAASGSPTRSADFDAPSEIPGAYTVAEFGTAYQGVLFVSLSSPGTIGVDPINFAMRSITAGANQSLSNLTNPTAINQDLLFDKASAILKTKDDAAPTNDLLVGTGDVSSSDNAGILTLKSGSAIAGNSGDVYVSSGDTTGSGATGNLNLNTGVPNAANSLSGSIIASTGNATGTGTSGDVSMGSGGTADGDSGGATLSSGNSSGAGNTGNVSLFTGTVGSGTRGKIRFLNGSEGTAGQIWTSIDTTGGGSWVSPAATSTNNKELFVLSGTDITNQYVDLTNVAKTNSIYFAVKGAPAVIEGASYDYSVSYTGGAGGNTRITFLNDLATGGLSALIAGDVVVVQYQY